MRSALKRGGWLLAGVVLVALLPGNGPALATAQAHLPAGGGTAGAPGEARRITLITGDQVIVSGSHVMVAPAADRPKARFLIRTVDGQQEVIPMDALPLLKSGQLDSRLFNVTLLLAYGYHNRPDGLPLIVSRSGLSVASVPGAALTKDLPKAKLAAVQPGRGSGFWKSLTAQTVARRGSRIPVTKVWLDGKRELALDVSVPLVGAPAAWQAGFDGTGVKVAVLDTGIDAAHPDLAGKVIAARDFTGRGQADTVGHGTHVAGIIAGNGAASGGRYRGVAPGVRLLDGKICLSTCSESEILQGMDWAVEQGAAVVNMSLSGFDFPNVDPVEQAINDLTAAHGVLFVASTGNDPDRRVGSPASADAALAVGATTKADALAAFSSRGPRSWDNGLKPDLAAPGQSIVSTRSATMVPVQPDRYVTFSGTSMSVPHVVGAAAILAQRNPGWEAETLKSALMASAKPLPGVSGFGVGAGRLDVARGYRQSIVTEPRAVNLGELLWPHTGPAVGKPVTYVNHGTEPVTLTLTATNAVGPAGQPIPAAAFYAEPSTVTVPAGDRVEVQLFADSKEIGPVYGSITGNLVATAGDTSVNTWFAVQNEAEAYDLNFLHIGRDGAPAAGTEHTIKRLDQPGTFRPTAQNPNKVRLPKGVYTVYASTGPSSDELTTLMIHPRLTVNRTDTLVVDARQAKPVVVTPPRDGLQWYAAAIGGHYEVPGNVSSVQLYGADPNTLFLGRLGPEQLVTGFRSWVRGTLYEPGPSTTVLDSPAVYHLAWFTERRVMTGFTRHVKHGDLATVRLTRAVNAPGSLAITGTTPLPPGTSGQAAVDPALFGFLPQIRTEYYTAEGGLRWSTLVSDFNPTFDHLITSHSAATRYLAGRTYTERWGHAVLGPTFPRQPLERMLSRDGDRISTRGAVSGDSEGRYGRGPDGPGKLRIYRDGVEFFSTDRLHSAGIDVPPTPATYRVEIDVPSNHGDLSKEVNVRWTFRSGHTEPGTHTPLPAWAVRFTPEVDEYGTAAYGGRAVAVPVIAESQADSGAGLVRRITVQASVDGGQTWVDAPLTRRGSGWTALVNHPAGDGFVTLRATVEDTRGNLLEQRIVNAYRFATPG